MVKKIIGRGVIGFFGGITLSYLITLAISLCVGDGSYHAIEPRLIEDFGTELNAILIQSALSGVMGLGCALASLIWDNERWGFLKQTVLHFFVVSLSILPIAYFCRWMEHSPSGILSYTMLFVCIYAFIWLALFITYKSKVNKINQALK